MTLTLTGWTLQAADGTPSITLSGTIPAGGYFLLERTDDGSEPLVAADQIYTGALNNEGENLVLLDSTSALIDQVNCSSGWFAGHAGSLDEKRRCLRAISGLDPNYEPASAALRGMCAADPIYGSSPE